MSVDKDAICGVRIEIKPGEEMNMPHGLTTSCAYPLVGGCEVAAIAACLHNRALAAKLQELCPLKANTGTPAES